MSSSQSLHIPRVAIIGLGLIGCSWVKALKLAGAAGSISGFDRNLDSMQQALQAGLIDDYSLEVADVVEGADLSPIPISEPPRPDQDS